MTRHFAITLAALAVIAPVVWYVVLPLAAQLLAVQR